VRAVHRPALGIHEACGARRSAPSLEPHQSPTARISASAYWS
jgi:hypothetical protein